MGIITTGSVPKALGGKASPAKPPKTKKRSKAFAGAHHNCGGPACHDGGKLAYPCSGR
jgi:hypothetical protein